MASHLLYLTILLYLNINLHTHTHTLPIHDLQHGTASLTSNKPPNRHPTAPTPHLHNIKPLHLPSSTYSTACRTVFSAPAPPSRLLRAAAPLSPLGTVAAPRDHMRPSHHPTWVHAKNAAAGVASHVKNPRYLERALSVYCVLQVFSESGENGASGKLGPAEHSGGGDWGKKLSPYCAKVWGVSGCGVGRRRPSRLAM